MVKQRVYLDTSVLSALDDTRWPDRAEMTRLFWAKRDQFELSTSETAQRELERTAMPSADGNSSCFSLN